MMLDSNGVSMSGYMAFGGTDPAYSITMTREVDGEMMDAAHSFMIAADEDTGIQMLSGQPNIVHADYNWVLNVMDSASDQHITRSWKLRVTQEAYPSGISTVSPTAEPAPGENDDEEWADFISSTHSGAVALAAEGVRGGIPASLNLAANRNANQDPPVPGSGTITGKIDPDVDDVADVDVFWVASLTPNSVLKLTVKGTTEAPNNPGVFNMVDVALHSFVTGEEKSDAEEGEMGEYTGLSCGDYYVEVSGEEGDYELTWEFTD
jgi:hypothetical protein